MHAQDLVFPRLHIVKFPSSLPTPVSIESLKIENKSLRAQIKGSAARIKELERDISVLEKKYEQLRIEDKEYQDWLQENEITERLVGR
jgi:septal ring factor EnvC (AmiA/AmiB activator)